MEIKQLKFKKWRKVIYIILYAIVLVCLEIMVRRNNTLLPICIPWMYDYVLMLFLPFGIASVKKWLFNSHKKFFDIYEVIFLKTIQFIILIPSIVFLPNKFIPIDEPTSCCGTISSIDSLKITRTRSSIRYYVKIKLIGDDYSFWYDLGKEIKPLGTKCDLTVRRGLFGLRFVEKVDFPME